MDGAGGIPCRGGSVEAGGGVGGGVGVEDVDIVMGGVGGIRGGGGSVGGGVGGGGVVAVAVKRGRVVEVVDVVFASPFPADDVAGFHFVEGRDFFGIATADEDGVD